MNEEEYERTPLEQIKAMSNEELANELSSIHSRCLSHYKDDEINDFINVIESRLRTGMVAVKVGKVNDKTKKTPSE